MKLRNGETLRQLPSSVGNSFLFYQQDEPCVAVDDTDDDCEIIKVEEANEMTGSEENAEQITENNDGKKSVQADGHNTETGESVTETDDSHMISKEDIDKFEMLEIRERNQPKVSQTATPNNTPLGNLFHVSWKQQEHF